MKIIDNVCIYGLEESIKASKYPMLTNIDSANSDVTETVKLLAKSDIGTGHDNFLNGIVVQFDLTFSLKAWTEAQRYHFLDFVSSESTMHRITSFNIPMQCNKYVTMGSIRNITNLVRMYNEEPTAENYLTVLYNIPTGFRLTARMTTNYRQLKTIYYQRRNHRLPEWREFCEWIETLPMMDEILKKGE